MWPEDRLQILQNADGCCSSLHSAGLSRLDVERTGTSRKTADVLIWRRPTPGCHRLAVAVRPRLCTLDLAKLANGVGLSLHGTHTPTRIIAPRAEKE